MSLRLSIIIGSTRPTRVGPSIAAWVTKVATAHQAFEAETVDLAEVGLPLLDEPNHPAQQKYTKEHTKRWSAIVDRADAFVFVTPEYDYFPPAALINAMQCLAREWHYKPAGVVSYGGVSGGLRSAQELRQLISNLSMVALPQTVPVPFVTQYLKDEGLQPNDAMNDGCEKMLDELGRWASALKPMRG